MITVGIIDRDERARTTTKQYLAENCTDAKQVVHIIFDWSTIDNGPDPKLRQPDILILDIEQQQPRIIEQVKSIFPSSEIIILTSQQDLNVVRSCFRQGAVSFLTKQTGFPYLSLTIDVTLNQGSFISPRINRALINQAAAFRKFEDMLTARELQVANGIAAGLSYKMIADQYKISLDTVRVYIKRVYRKLNINSKGELMSHFSAATV